MRRLSEHFVAVFTALWSREGCEELFDLAHCVVLLALSWMCNAVSTGLAVGAEVSVRAAEALQGRAAEIVARWDVDEGAGHGPGTDPHGPARTDGGEEEGGVGHG